MVTQAPKRSAVIAALAFTLSCIGLMIFVWTQFRGTIPFAPQGYRIQALFHETGLLVPNADVRIAGVNVGKVAAVKAEGVNSLVTLDIGHQYAPIPSDTRAILRQKTLLGEAYVALSTGNGAGRKLPDGGTIPTSQIEPTQQLDQVLNSFDSGTQRNLQALLNGTAASLSGDGLALNEAVGNLDPTLTELAAVVGELNAQQGNLQTLVSDTGTVLGTLGNRASDLQSLITAGDQVFSATAARDTALTATVNALPPFLSQLRTTLTGLNGTLGIAKPSLDALQPVAPLLTPALRDVISLSGPATKLLREAPGLLTDADAALPAITRFTRAFHPAVDRLLPAAEQVAPMITFIAQYATELTTAMANLSAVLEATAPANTKATAGTPAGIAHYIRAVISLSDESVYGQSVRAPDTRSNTYFSPGELANIARGGLLSNSCANEGNAPQIPVLVGNVPCRVQGPLNWGNGVAPGYYPRVTAARP